MGLVAVGCLLSSWMILPAWGYDNGVVAQQILKSTMTGNGQKIEYLKTDKAEITAAIVEFAPGAETGWHKHPVPVYAYVLEGTLKVMVEGGKEYVFEKDQAIIEVVNLAHNGKNVGKGKVRLAVFYTGEENTPSTIKLTPPSIR